MQTFFTFQNVFDSIVSIGIIAYAIGQFKVGKKVQSKEEIETENNTMTLQGSKIKVLENALKEQQEISTEYGKKIAALEAVNVEKDKTIKEYLAILQNRNPELDKVLCEILEFMKKINTHMEQDLNISATVTHTK